MYLCIIIIINRGAIQSTCKMLMCLSLSSSKRDVYEEDFERPFLQMSREFYKVSVIIIIISV